MKLDNYKTLVFDCDGVVLNSNKVKTQAFYNAALPYGERLAQALVEYHVANGGISRYKKFELFLSEMVPRGVDGPNLDDLLTSYAVEVQNGLLACEVAQGLRDLREKTRHTNWLIVSGGDQVELREVFSLRCLSCLFDGGIFGSPESKDQILAREIESENIKMPSLFIGDSKYDFSASNRVGMDFLFVHGWSEFKDGQYLYPQSISYLKDLL